ncbi:DUF1641 domain-containing protein [Stygiolobus sp. CP850M]|jgi:uncharacterized protein YjgD (DUF1641 family)|uniref:DUF1641 domain-containing protein n=1 Tax=Stygiolobus sp. CP850M TaxID=3133134 RepID=UPI00307DD436
MSADLQLESLLSDEKLSSITKLVDILSTAENKYGLLSAIQGFLSDEEMLGKVLSSIINDQTLDLMTKWNNLMKLADMFADESTIENLNAVLDLVGILNKTGILDPIKGLLQDEETLGKILSAIVNDSTLNVISNWGNIVKLMEFATKEDTLTTLNDVIELYSKIKKLGLIDVIKGMLDDEETIGKVMSGIVNDFTFNLMSNWSAIVKDLSKIDLTNFKYYTLLVNETGEALKEQKIMKIDHWWDLLNMFKDPEVRVGLGVVIAILKHIGRYHMQYVVNGNHKQ